MVIEGKHLTIPDVFEYTDNYVSSERPMLAITKYVMGLRKDLRKTVLEAKDADEISNIMEKYWKCLAECYVVERDMYDMSKFFVDNVGVPVCVSALYHFLHRTKLLYDIPQKAIHTDRLPFNPMDFKEYFNAWWPIIFFELEEDPRKVLGDSVKFKEVSSSTVIEDTDYRGKMKKKGMEIIRRNGEIFSGEEEEGGVVVVYVWIQDNPSDRVFTKTVFCFSIGNEKKPEIRVFPIVLNVESGGS
jgi:uncharacterized protein YuzB (UPF0349 family)